MSKILKSWAGEEALKKFAVLNIGTPWYDSESSMAIHSIVDSQYPVETGERQGYAEWKPAVMQETGGDFLCAKVRRSIHRIGRCG